MELKNLNFEWETTLIGVDRMKSCGNRSLVGTKHSKVILLVNIINNLHISLTSIRTKKDFSMDE